MKKAIVGALIGAILVFGWQAISHMFLRHHDTAYRQIAGQDSLIQSLSGFFKEDGQYLVPRSNPNGSQEEMAKYNESMHGKPWALITFHRADNSNMGIAAIRSFTTAFLSVLIFIWLIGKNPRNFLTVVIKSIAVACFVFLFVYYNSNIWLQTPWDVISPELIDLLAAWTLCGIWLGWWLNRRQVRRY